MSDGKNWIRFKGAKKHPPIHRGCVCGIAPVVEAKVKPARKPRVAKPALAAPAAEPGPGNFKSTREVETWLKKKIPTLKDVALGKTPLHVAEDVATTLAENEWMWKPQTPLTRIRMMSSNRRYGQMKIGEGTMSLSSKWYGNPDRFTTQFKSDTSGMTPFHPPLKEGATAWKAVTDHEYGHAIASAWHGNPQVKAEIFEVKKKYYEALGKARRDINDHPEWTPDQKAARMKGVYISRYAEKNYKWSFIDEFIAECYTMTRNSAVVSPFATQVVDILAKYYGKPI